MRVEIESMDEAVDVAKSLADFLEKGLVASGFRNPIPNEHRYYTEQRQLIAALRRMLKP